MKKPVVDYRKLRLSNITSNEYRHLLLLIGWVIYFIMYFVTENLIPADKCHVVYSKVDDLIPFNEYFVLSISAFKQFLLRALVKRIKLY